MPARVPACQQPTTSLLCAACRWTANPAVADLFDSAAKMITQDKQTFHGKQAVLKRLDKGGWARAGQGGHVALAWQAPAQLSLPAALLHKLKCSLLMLPQVWRRW